MTEFINKLKDFSLNLLFPKHCLNCGQIGSYLCQNCFTELAAKTEIQKCPICSLRNFSGVVCGPCRKYTPIKRFIYAFDYKNRGARELIHALKYNFVKELAFPLSEFLVETIKINQIKIPKTIILVPVPLHPAKLRRRGFNQSELIARGLSEKLGLISVAGNLSRQKNTEPQVNFSDFKERRKNIFGVFFVKNLREFAGKKSILVDDVSTSRGTLDEAAAALVRAGARSVWGMAVAKG